MKYLIILLLLSGCMTTKYTMHLDCNADNEEIFMKFNQILRANQITDIDFDENLMTLTGITEPNFNETVTHHWVFWLGLDGIQAEYYTMRIFEEYQIKSRIYSDDNHTKNDDWYWGVREQLNRICPNIKFTTKEVKQNL